MSTADIGAKGKHGMRGGGQNAALNASRCIVSKVGAIPTKILHLDPPTARLRIVSKTSRCKTKKLPTSRLKTGKKEEGKPSAG